MPIYKVPKMIYTSSGTGWVADELDFTVSGGSEVGEQGMANLTLHVNSPAGLSDAKATIRTPWANPASTVAASVLSPLGGVEESDAHEVRWNFAEPLSPGEIVPLAVSFEPTQDGTFEIVFSVRADEFESEHAKTASVKIVLVVGSASATSA